MLPGVHRFVVAPVLTAARTIALLNLDVFAIKIALLKRTIIISNLFGSRFAINHFLDKMADNFICPLANILIQIIGPFCATIDRAAWPITKHEARNLGAKPPSTTIVTPLCSSQDSNVNFIIVKCTVNLH